MTSRMALSAAIFTVLSGSRILNRKSAAFLIRHWTTKSMSMMFWSEVSIRLSSGTSRAPPRVTSPEPRKPMLMVLVRSTFGLMTSPMGAGNQMCKPGGVRFTYSPNSSSTPCSPGFTR